MCIMLCYGWSCFHYGDNFILAGLNEDHDCHLPPINRPCGDRYNKTRAVKLNLPDELSAYSLRNNTRTQQYNAGSQEWKFLPTELNLVWIIAG